MPTDIEWQTLEATLGMPANELNSQGIRGEAQNVGGVLKSTSTLWAIPNWGANNESGFSGVPGGNRFNEGSFYDLGANGVWWSAAEQSAENAWYRYVYYNDAGVQRSYYDKRLGVCLRCLRD